MGTSKIKAQPPPGYERSFKLSRSEKTFVAGITVLFTGLLNVTLAFQATDAPPDLLALRTAQTSSFLMLLYALQNSFFLRIGSGMCLLGLLLLLIGYLNRRDEKDGKIQLPPKYKKKI